MNSKYQCKKCFIVKSDFTLTEIRRKTYICKECLKKNNQTLTAEQKQDKQRKNIQDQKINLKDISIEINPHIVNYFELKETDIEFCAQYIDYSKIDIDIEIPTAIQSVMGTGKTQYVRYIIQQARKQNKTVCYACPNISTIEDTREQLQSNNITVSSYKDSNISDVVLTTIDSIDKFIDRDILIVDEVYSVFEELSLKSNIQSTGILTAEVETRYRKILEHKNVFILDRFIAPVLRMFNAFQLNPNSTKQNEHIVIKNNYKKTKEIYINEFRIAKIMLDVILDHTDNEILIQSSERRTVEGLNKKLNNLGIPCVIKTSIARDLSNTVFNQHNLKLSSPVISRGVSLSADKVWIIDSGRTVGVVGMIQMTDRARNSKVINVKVSNGSKQKNKLLDMYSKLINCDINNRIIRFLRMSDLVESNHKQAYLYLLKQTYSLT